MVQERMDDETVEAVRLNFDNLANLPATWLFVADNLRFATRFLEPHFAIDLTKESDHERIVTSARLQGPLLMLRGCALEALLKALYVAGGNKLGENGRYLSPGGKDHDLVNLARKAAFALTPSQETLLAYVGQYISLGRYPMAKRSPESYSLLADGSRRATIWSEDDEREYQDLDRLLRAEVVRVARESGHA